MFKFLLVTPDKDALSSFAFALEKYSDIRLSWVKSGSKAVEMVSDNPVDLVGWQGGHVFAVVNR